MNNVTVRFFNGNTLVRTEIFPSELEAEMYIGNETIEYEYYTIEVGITDAF